MYATTDQATSQNFKFKIVFLGNQNVGKTSLIHRFIYETFEDNYQATIGIDFMSQKMHIEDKVVILNLWDTAGQERFKSLIPSYIKDSAVAIVCYDVTSRDSFVSVEKWVEDAKAIRENDVLLILVGNKADMEPQRQVPLQEAKDYADKMNFLFYETSAKTGNNVKLVFNDLAKKLTGIELEPSLTTDEKPRGFVLGAPQHPDQAN